MSDDKKYDICFLWITIEEEQVPPLKVITDALNISKLVNDSIAELGCNNEDTLRAICAPGEGGPRIPKPQSCPSPPGGGGGGPGGKGRKKRQSGPGPGPGPGSGPGPGPGPGPNACPGPNCDSVDEPPPADEDFKRDAEFLKQLMSLDVATRSRIGHRYIQGGALKSL